MQPEAHTPHSFSRAGLGALALLVILLPACQAVRMSTPGELAASERMPVSGRQGLMIKQQVRFGPFETHQVKRSWTRGRDRGATTLATESERRQAYSFTLREGGEDRWFVACHASVREVIIETRIVEMRPASESALYCNLKPTENAASAWEMVLDEQRARPLSGVLSLDGAAVEVKGTNRTDRTLSLGSTAGYEFREAGAVIGAVEVINSGAVWLRGDQGVDRRSLLSAASAALLLLEDLRETLRD